MQDSNSKFIKKTFSDEIKASKVNRASQYLNYEQYVLDKIKKPESLATIALGEKIEKFKDSTSDSDYSDDEEWSHDSHQDIDYDVFEPRANVSNVGFNNQNAKSEGACVDKPVLAHKVNPGIAARIAKFTSQNNANSKVQQSDANTGKEVQNHDDNKQQGSIEALHLIKPNFPEVKHINNKNPDKSLISELQKRRSYIATPEDERKKSDNDTSEGRSPKGDKKTPEAIVDTPQQGSADKTSLPNSVGATGLACFRYSPLRTNTSSSASNKPSAAKQLFNDQQKNEGSNTNCEKKPVSKGKAVNDNRYVGMNLYITSTIGIINLTTTIFYSTLLEIGFTGNAIATTARLLLLSIQCWDTLTSINNAYTCIEDKNKIKWCKTLEAINSTVATSINIYMYTTGSMLPYVIIADFMLQNLVQKILIPKLLNYLDNNSEISMLAK